MKNTIINSTIALTIAYLLTIILHELAHYLMSISLGYESIIYHNRVWSNIDGIVNHEILIAGIAPLFSLLLGVLTYQFSKRMIVSPMSLLMLWLGVAGVITFFGYLMIAPLIPIGDTGKVFNLLNVPMVVQIVLAILSLPLITVFLMKSAKAFERYAIEDFGSIRLNRQKWSYALIFYPLFISIVLVTLLQFPIPHFISILATICAPFSIMAAFGSFIGSKEKINRSENEISINSKISIPLIVSLVVVIVINRILVYGV